MRGALLTVLSAGVFFQCLSSAPLPPNPCPDLFQYLQDKNGDTYGRVMLENDHSGNYDILVNMSYSGFLDDEEQNLEIEMESTLDNILAGCPIVYNISFPIQGVIPRITRIKLNNKVYCTGPSEELGPRGVTEIWAGYYYRTNQPPKPLSVKPEQRLHPRCTLFNQQPPLHYSTTSFSESWQQPSAAPTTSALSSSSTWKPQLTASNMNAPLTSWSWRPWSRRPSSTVPTTSASLSSNTWRQPSNPCPTLFQYQQGEDDVFGRVMLDNDYSGYYDISVYMSIAAYLVGEQNLEIEMESTLDDILAGCPLIYNITFPIQGVIPRLTRIELNNKVYCTGPSEELGPRGVTKMWAAHYYRTNQPPKPLSAKPKPKLHPNCTLITHQPPFQNSTISPSEPWQQPSTASTMSIPLSSSTWQPPLTASTTDTPLPSRTWLSYLTIYPIPASSSSSPWQQPSAAPTTSVLLSSSTWQPPLTASTMNAPLISSSTASTTSTPLSSSTWQPPLTALTTDTPLPSRTWPPYFMISPTPASSSSNPWQQPSAAPTTSALLSSSTWKPPLTASTMNAPLISWTWKPWSQRPSSTATSNSASLSSNTWWQPSETTTTAAPLSSNTWQPYLTASTTDAPLTSRPWRPWSWQPSSTASTTSVSLILNTWQQPSTDSTTSASMSSEPLMHSAKPIQVLDWLSRKPSVAASTAASLIEEFSLSGKECGLTMVNTRASVIDGDDLLDGEFPWLVGIMYRQELAYHYKCTGSLVSSRHVITAGHCVKGNKEIENYLLVFGTEDLQSSVSGAVLRELQNIIVHPDYKGNPGDSDIAILIVKDKIVFEDRIKPVCLWPVEEHVGKMAGMQGTVVGWWTDRKRKFVDAKKASLTIVPQLECFQSSSSFLYIISFKTFCAGLERTGFCYGNRGAGFVIKKNGRWILRGVMSTALGDLDSCDVDNYFVFVDIYKVMNWLKLEMM